MTRAARAVRAACPQRNQITWRVLLSSVACLGVLAVTTPASIPNVTADRINTSSQELARYKGSHSLNDLDSAVASLDGTIDVRALTPDNFIETRRAIVGAWAAVLKQIEDSYDPSFNPNDPNNVPFLCPPVPASAGHVVYQSCTKPDDIKDAQTRAIYVAAIKDNEAKKSRWTFYLHVHQDDLRAMSGLSASLKLLKDIAPAGVGPDFAALHNLLKAAGVSEKRRKAIDAWFDSSP